MDEPDTGRLSAVAVNCSLKTSKGPPSSTDRMIGLLASDLEALGVQFAGAIRLADYNIKPGVTSDEGDGDDWPQIRRRILASDILIFGTPIWLGQLCSIGKRALERMDAFLSETDQQGRTPAFSKVVIAGIVGNEDGAHWVTAQLFQALSDVGWTVPAQAVCYWVGEAMGSTDFKDLPEAPSKVRSTSRLAASSGAHLARLLRSNRYPGA